MEPGYLKKHFPYVLEILTSLAGAIGAHWLVKKEGGERQIDPEIVKKTLRMEAPHFAKNQADEARFAQVLADLPDVNKKQLLEQWLSTVGNNQRADFILTVAEMTTGTDEAKTQKNWERAINQLMFLARIPTNGRRTTIAAAMRFMKPREEEYAQTKVVNGLKQLREVVRNIDSDGRGVWASGAAREGARRWARHII